MEVFFFVPFKFFNFFLNFILKSEGEKRSVNRWEPKAQLLQKQSQPMSKCLFPLLAGHPFSTSIYGHSSTTVLFFSLTLYSRWEMVQYSGNNLLALVHNEKLLKVDRHIILQRYTL